MQQNDILRRDLGADGVLRLTMSDARRRNALSEAMLEALGTAIEEAGRDPRYPLIFDPQTAGGLLASVPGDRADACVAALQKLGYARTMIVGEVREESDRLEPITVKV